MSARATRSQVVRSTRNRPLSADPGLIKAKRELSSSPGLDTVPIKEPLPKRQRVKKDPESSVKRQHAALTLREKKAKLHAESLADEPFPTFPRPSAQDSHLAHSILCSLHGKRVRPAEVVASKDRAGCGDSPSVLDALVRTILSQNTSDANSTRAKLSMDRVYGGSDEWDKIAAGGKEKLQEAIKCGGLSVVKSKVILNILDQVKGKYGAYSLDHLHKAETDDAMQELLSFDGVGPKTASCVLLFSLGREDFAVDTHVHRITGLLGWRPKTANREQTYHHLNKRIPDEEKYGLHILLVTHGKRCDECKAGGRYMGKCELRKAFKEGAMDGQLEKVKEEVKPEVKEELAG
ncbi:hypothetical protein IAR55_005182 [Kwoniella newhampshirensis]|uniref:HhH-GPD domain-containing protein n=1 Tax=Kwoniella newhampshirensis TaxID=1651941 RepID=A0AAW0YMV6_9TREE